MGTQEWPIDFDSLHKDMVIEQGIIERAYAVKYITDPDKYMFKQLALIDEIRKRRSDLSGHVRGDHQSIRIMTDIEADDWQSKRYRESVDSIVRIGKRRGSIDRSGFDDHRMRKSDSLDVSIAATIITARSERRRHNRLVAVMESQRLLKHEETKD